MTIACKTCRVSAAGARLHYPIKVTVRAGEAVTYDVAFSPTASARYEAGIKVVVMDNKYENLNVQMVGEGYTDVITLNIDNLGSTAGHPKPDLDLDDEDIQGN